MLVISRRIARVTPAEIVVVWLAVVPICHEILLSDRGLNSIRPEWPKRMGPLRAMSMPQGRAVDCRTISRPYLRGIGMTAVAHRRARGNATETKDV
jgi:hypothetical protein